MTEVAIPETTGSELLARLEALGVYTPIGLRLPAHVEQDRMAAIGAMLGTAREAVYWGIGDYIVACEEMYGEEGYQFIEALGISEVSRQQYIRSAKVIPYERRVMGLSWSHHRSVLALEPADQDRYLRLALENGWTKGQLEEAIREEFHPDRSRRAQKYVVEAVCNAAERVWETSAKAIDGNYVVPAKEMEDLMYALGVET